MLSIDVICALPESINGYFTQGILSRAQESGICKITVHNLRSWTTDSRKTIDDHPFGGSPGMLLKIEPIYAALKDLNYLITPGVKPDFEVWITDAAGEVWNQASAAKYSTSITRLCIICGRYEGVDNRVIENLITKKVSLGKFVLTGGELAAAVIIDSMVRLIPGALGNQESLISESHNTNISDYPQYTRPAEFTTDGGEVLKVPEVLVSGNHQAIKQWQLTNQSPIVD